MELARQRAGPKLYTMKAISKLPDSLPCSPLTPALPLNRNIEHRTSNAERRAAAHASLTWAFEVRGWLFDVPSRFRDAKREIGFRGVLSPLRGEGGHGNALGSGGVLAVIESSLPLGHAVQMRRPTTPFPKTSLASPSPLNGERPHEPPRLTICAPEPPFCNSLQIKQGFGRFMGRAGVRGGQGNESGSSEIAS